MIFETIEQEQFFDNLNPSRDTPPFPVKRIYYYK